MLGDEHFLVLCSVDWVLVVRLSEALSSLFPDSALRSRWISQNRERVILALVES